MEELSFWAYPLLIAGGLLAGFINTLAGNGSAVSLALMTYLGLPANIANGTNRIAVLVQSLIAYRTFDKKGLVDKQNLRHLLIPTLSGALLGASLAVELNERMMNLVLGILMFILLIIVIANPKKWLANHQPDAHKVKSLTNLLILFAVGFHGGFVQAGVGIFLLAALVLGTGYGLMRANGIKLLLVLLLTIPALLLFVCFGQVNWYWGIILSIGQAAGAWLAARFATQHKNAQVWVRRILIMVIILGIFKFWGNVFYG